MLAGGAGTTIGFRGGGGGGGAGSGGLGHPYLGGTWTPRCSIFSK